MAETKAPVERPLSPHLFIYKPMLTMMMSIVHRITGVGLYFGTLLLAWWLIAAASGPNAYAGIGSFMSSFVGPLILFGYTWALIHHMLGGIRHLIWDTGHGFGPQEREWLALATAGRIDRSDHHHLGGRLSLHGRAALMARQDEHAARARARPRLGQVRHRAFLAPAPDRGRQRAADHRLRGDRGRRCSAATTPRWCRSSARRWSPS